MKRGKATQLRGTLEISAEPKHAYGQHNVNTHNVNTHTHTHTHTHNVTTQAYAWLCAWLHTAQESAEARAGTRATAEKWLESSRGKLGIGAAHAASALEDMPLEETCHWRSPPPQWMERAQWAKLNMRARSFMDDAWMKCWTSATAAAALTTQSRLNAGKTIQDLLNAAE